MFLVRRLELVKRTVDTRLEIRIGSPSVFRFSPYRDLEVAYKRL